MKTTAKAREVRDNNLSTSDEDENYGGGEVQLGVVRGRGNFLKVLHSPNKRYSITSQQAIGWNSQPKSPPPAIKVVHMNKRPSVMVRPRIKSIIAESESELSLHVPPELKAELNKLKHLGEEERQKIVKDKMLAYFQLFLDKTLKEKLDARLDNLEVLSCNTTVGMKETCYILSAAEFKLKSVIPRDLWSYAFYESEGETEKRYQSDSSETNTSVGEMHSRITTTPGASLKEFDARFSSLALGHLDEIGRAKELAQQILSDTKKGIGHRSVSKDALYDKLTTYLSGQNRSQVLRRNKLLESIYREVADKSRELERLGVQKKVGVPQDQKDQCDRRSILANRSCLELGGPEEAAHKLAQTNGAAQQKMKWHTNCSKEHFEVVREQKSKQKMTADGLNRFLQRNLVAPGFEDTFTPDGKRVCRKIEPELAKTIAKKTSEEFFLATKVQTYYNHDPMKENDRRDHVQKVVMGEVTPHYLRTYKEPNQKKSKTRDKTPPMLFGTIKTETSPTRGPQTSSKKLYSTSQERRELVQKFLSGEDIFTHLKPTETLKNYTASRSKSPQKSKTPDQKAPFFWKKPKKSTFVEDSPPKAPEKLDPDHRKALMRSFLSNPKENILSHQICNKTPREKLSASKAKPFVPSGQFSSPKPAEPAFTLTQTKPKPKSPPRQISTVRNTLQQQIKMVEVVTRPPVVPTVNVPPKVDSDSELPLESGSPRESVRTKVVGDSHSRSPVVWMRHPSTSTRIEKERYSKKPSQPN